MREYTYECLGTSITVTARDKNKADEKLDEVIMAANALGVDFPDANFELVDL